MRRPCAMVFAMGMVAVSCGSSAPDAAIDSALVGATVESTAIATTAPAAQPTVAPASTPTPVAVPSPPAPTVVEVPEPTATEAPTPVVTAEPAANAIEGAAPAPPTVVPPPATNTSTEAQVANGGEVYTLNCARCHGENGMGSAQYSGLIGVGSRYSNAGMIAELTTGHPVTFGFADRLSADEIASVVAYVKATFP